MKRLPKHISDKLQDKNVDPEKFRRLASGVNPADLDNEQKVRQLIRQLALISNTKMSKELEDKVYQQIKKYNINGNNIKALSSMLKGKF